MAKELAQAGEIQRRLLPAKAPLVPGLELAGMNLPCRTVGGDYYDFFPLSDGRVALVVGDVAGKGMPAAMLMSSLQARLQILLEADENPASIVQRLNKSIAANCPDNRFITFFLAIVDVRSGEIRYCNAGHNPPLLIRAGGFPENLQGGGIILGILPIAQYSEHRAQMEPGDTLVLFSDGVSEAMPAGSDEEFGEMRISMAVMNRSSQPPAAVIDGIMEDLQNWCAGAPYADDVTILIAKRSAA
jgi:sigma-B regulation protein RsbU (phosphoserine phosphatase)